jgi:hypothetical protein
VEHRAQVASDHPADHRVDIEFGGRRGEHEPAVPHDRHPLAAREHLLQPVRDEQDGGAAAPQRHHDLEQPVYLDIGQRRRGLVHDQDPGLQGERLGDLDDLLVGH